MTQVQNLGAVQLSQKAFNGVQNAQKGYAYLLNEPIEDKVELNSNKEDSKVLGAVAGGAISAGVGYVAHSDLKLLSYKMQEVAEKVNVDENLVNRILNKTGLSKKGVKLNNFAKGAPIALDPISEKMISAIKNGKNAAYNPVDKTVMVNLEKAGGTVFHEIGHAINANKSKFWRALQKVRPVAMFAPLALFLTAILKSKKAEGEKAVGFWDKTTTFIKENVGKLTTLAMLPILAEELRATAVGNKLAKAVLKPEQFKQVVKSNKIGAVSYAAVALLSGFSAMFATKVRDKVAKKD